MNNRPSPLPNSQRRKWDRRTLHTWFGRRRAAAIENPIQSSQEIGETAEKIHIIPADNHQAAALTVIDKTPIAENDDFWKQQIRRRWLTWAERRARRNSRRWTVKAWRAIKKKVRREKTAAELADQAEQEERKKLEKFHQEQARWTERILRETLTRLQFSRMETKEGAMKVIDEVKFDIIKFSPLAYYYHVGHYPHGVSIVDMSTPEVCTNLAAMVGHRVRVDSDFSIGLVYTVEIGSTMGIPDFVSFGEMMEVFPKNLPDLAFPVGVTSNGRRVYRALEEFPHLLVAGSTGKGKSNEINAIVCALLMRNSPEKMRMMLIDLKGGVEFDIFSGIPHLVEIDDAHGDIVESVDNVIPALEWIIKEGERRLRKLKRAKKKNIAEYNNRRQKNRLPRLVMVIDELAMISLSPIQKEAENKLMRITNLYRAAGIHVILATQTPKKEILSTLISANFPNRMAFGMPKYASQVVLGNWSAAGLEPVGRMILQINDEEIQVQAPRITEKSVESVIAMAKGESDEAVLHSLDALEILHYALKNLSGDLKIRDLYAHFQDRIARDELLKMLQDLDGLHFIVDGTSYQILPGAGTQPRKMVRADDSE